MTNEQFTFFWHGPFSQWYGNDPANPRAVQFRMHGIDFNCAEKYMMWRKATLFQDHVTEQLILQEYSPREIKRLGRLVKGFNEDVWNANCKDFVFTGNIAKFSQNPDLHVLLADTDGTTLVEASPYDKIWGIGMADTHPDCRNRSKWLGTNWLGEVLTMVREALSG